MNIHRRHSPQGINRKSFARLSFGLMALLLVAICSLSLHQKSANAASLANWNAGQIIDDATMSNKDSMTVAQIQSFLNSKVPTCDTNGQQLSEYGGPDLNGDGKVQRWEWGQANYSQTTFTCLKDYTENGLSSAQIIYNAAQKYSINPQVLIVLLQKEQGLVTDTWPLNLQYKTATGYGCPDTAPCDTQYYGLTNQLNWSATMFRAILDNSPTWYTPYILGDNYIQWNPNSSCGGSTVNIVNRATQALYNYTPYQPNQAALNAGYGNGDACSSYGNRNFYLYFSDWFGIAPVSTLYLPDGTYTLTNKNSGRMLDVADGSTSDGASIQLYDSNDTPAQRWEITKDSENYYSFRNINSGKYLDATDAGTQPGTLTQLWQGNSTCAQKWAVVSVSGSVSFLNKCSGLALDAIGGNTVNGTKIQLWNSNYTNAQAWSLITYSPEPLSSGFYEISVSGGLVVGTTANSSDNGTPVEINSNTDTSTQRWQISRQPDGYYVIRNPESGRLFDVENASTEDGAAIRLVDLNPLTCAQKWIITGSQDVGYTLQTACADKVLDVRDGTLSTPGSVLQTWADNGTLAQKWYFTNSTGNLPNSTYTILSMAGTALDITGGSSVSGTPLQIWQKNGSGAQVWQSTLQSDGSYSFVNPSSGKYLDVRNAQFANGTRMQIWTGNDSCAQKWNLVDKGDGGFEILSACSNAWALDIAGGRISSIGSPVQLYSRNGSGAQVWVFGAPW